MPSRLLIPNVPQSAPGDVKRYCSQANDVFRKLETEPGLLPYPTSKDITPQKILTAIKTVDGHDSGLNADLLDGKNGSEYAPSTLANELPRTNLAMNGDFLYPVNQRGLTTMSGGSLAIDRWLYARSTIVVTSNGLNFYWDGVNGTDGVFYQNIEAEMLNRYRGSDVTVSVVIGGTTYSVVCSIPASPTNGQTITSVTVTTGVTVTFVYYSTGTTVPAYRINIRTTKLSASPATLQGVKIEPGSVATPIIPRFFADELALCQRYFQIRSTNTVADVDLRPTMRATPTKTLNGSVYWYNSEIL